MILTRKVKTDMLKFFHETCILPRTLPKRSMFMSKLQGSHFSFPCKCNDRITTSENVYSNIINKSCSVLSTAFQMSAFAIDIEKNCLCKSTTASLDCETSKRIVHAKRIVCLFLRDCISNMSPP